MCVCVCVRERERVRACICVRVRGGEGRGRRGRQRRRGARGRGRTHRDRRDAQHTYTAQHSTAQHITAQHSTRGAQHAAHLGPRALDARAELVPARPRRQVDLERRDARLEHRRREQRGPEHRLVFVFRVCVCVCVLIFHVWVASTPRSSQLPPPHTQNSPEALAAAGARAPIPTTRRALTSSSMPNVRTSSGNSYHSGRSTGAPDTCASRKSVYTYGSSA